MTFGVRAKNRRQRLSLVSSKPRVKQHFAGCRSPVDGWSDDQIANNTTRPLDDPYQRTKGVPLALNSDPFVSPWSSKFSPSPSPTFQLFGVDAAAMSVS